jgi:3-dehydroquinate synthetase
VAAALRLDKKRQGAMLRYVVLHGIGAAEVVPLSGEELVSLLGDHENAFPSEVL